MGRFMTSVATRHGVDADWPSLHRWSVEHPADFWKEFADFAGVRFATPPATVFDAGEAMPDARWFVGATFNYAEQLLRGPAAHAAVIARDETGRRRELNRGELREEVLRVAGGLRELGVGRGDRVAAVLPNGIEALVAMLACVSLGAVFSSCSPDFGNAAILDRLGQIRPRVLFVCDGYHYAGKRIECLPRLQALAARLPELRATVLVQVLGAAGDSDGLTDFTTMTSADPVTSFEQLPFEHPLCILYSSGTTGKPKCIVHSAGGTLLQHLKEHLLHTDLQRGDRLFYFTTCGWMMWNWLAGALASGATIVLYDGSPFHPEPLALWRMAAEEGVTVFGTSPRYLTACEKDGGLAASDLRLDALRTVLSTGAPLQPAGYDFVARTLGDVQLCSISGGTDIISCFVLGNPLLPVRRGEIQGPGLGMAVAVYDDSGHALEQGDGHLVCERPFPSMPLGFLDDPGRERFLEAYFSRFAGVWAQGDHAEWTAAGGMVIHGRGDAVMNPGGVRIGSAEVTGPALTVDGITDALAVGQRVDGDERIVLFVVITPGMQLDDSLREALRDAIRLGASPRHVPAVIAAVPDLPRTISGKPVELAVRAVIHGETVTNTDALANPEALEYFREIGGRL